MDKAFLLASDLHLTAKRRDAYRWQVFDFLAMHIERLCALHSWYDLTVVLCGDLVDAKDRHPAALVDPLVAAITRLAKFADVVLLEGNHDYIDHNEPFFGFLDRLDGVTYIKDPGPMDIAGMNVLMLPHRRDWSTGSEWRRRTPLTPKTYRADGPIPDRYDYILAHQTFNGAMASNGDRMEGVPLSAMAVEMTNGAPVLSGDIHVPQKIGNVTYVGSPHPVCFGDDYEDRKSVV